MKWQFYRFYGLIILASCLVVFSFNELIKSVEKHHNNYTVDIAYLLDAYEGKNAATNSQALSLPQFTYIDINCVSAHLQAKNKKLLQGETISLLDTNQHTFYYRLADKNDQALQIGPFMHQAPAQDYIPYIIMVFYSCLALILLAFMRPLFLGLFRLQKQAVKFGQKPQIIPVSVAKTSSIYPLAQSLSTMSEKLVSLLNLHRDLSRAISHEIRTPLSRMKFMLEIVSPSFAAEDKEQLFDDITEIEALIESYLNFAKIDNSQASINIRSHYIAAVFKSLHAKNAIYAGTVTLKFSQNVNKVECDRNLIFLALQNLISNAIRYAGKHIEVKMIRTESHYCLSVEDDGPGLSTDSDQITQAFQRGEDENDTTGFGLGLYIVKTVAEKHLGEFSIDRSEQLGGAKMTLSWPVKN